MSVVFLVATCIAAGIGIRLLRRWPRLVFIASLAATVLLGILLATAPSGAGDFLGRTLTLETPDRAFLWLCIGIAAALAFFGPLTFEHASNLPSIVIANSQGAFFFWSLAALIVAIAIDSFPLAIFSWAIGLIVLMLLAQPQREGRAGGAAQFLLLTVVAAASLLISSHFFDLYPLTPENLDLVRNAVIFLALGMGLLLGVVPLHIWLGPLADELPGLGVAFLVGVAQPVGVWLLFQQLAAVNWLTERSPVLTVLLVGGLITLPIGALLSLSERRDGRLIAYLSLVPLGHVLIGLGLGTNLGLAGAILSILNRAIGIVLFAGGLSFVRHHAERRWQFIGAFAVLIGGSSLAGIPPSVGFAARYPIYIALASTYPTALALLFVSDAAIVLTVLRIGWRVLQEDTQADEFTGELKIVPYLCTGVVIVLVIAIVAAGIFPQLIVDPLLAVLSKAAYLK